MKIGEMISKGLIVMKQCSTCNGAGNCVAECANGWYVEYTQKGHDEFLARVKPDLTTLQQALR